MYEVQYEAPWFPSGVENSAGRPGGRRRKESTAQKPSTTRLILNQRPVSLSRAVPLPFAYDPRTAIFHLFRAFASPEILKQVADNDGTYLQVCPALLFVGDDSPDVAQR